MSKCTSLVARFLSSEDGPTAVEYAVMLGLIVVVCILSISLLGQRTSDNFNQISNVMPSGS